MKPKVLFLIIGILILTLVCIAKRDQDPSLSLAKFSNIKIGMKYVDVVKLVGEPTQYSLPWNEYKIGEGWYIGFVFSSDTLADIRIMDYPNNRVFELEEDIGPTPCYGFFYSNGALTEIRLIDCPDYQGIQLEQDQQWCPSGWACSPPVQSAP